MKVPQVLDFDNKRPLIPILDQKDAKEISVEVP